MLKPLKTREKIALGFMSVSVASSLVFIILLSINLTYEVSSQSSTSPKFTEVLDTSCPNDHSTASTNKISIRFKKGGAGLYSMAIVSLVFSIISFIPMSLAVTENKTDTIENIIKNIENNVLS